MKPRLKIELGMMSFRVKIDFIEAAQNKKQKKKNKHSPTLYNKQGLLFWQRAKREISTVNQGNFDSSYNE